MVRHAKIDAYLTSKCLQNSATVSTLHIKKDVGDLLIIILHVDSGEEKIAYFKADLRSTFEMSDLRLL